MDNLSTSDGKLNDDGNICLLIKKVKVLIEELISLNTVEALKVFQEYHSLRASEYIDACIQTEDQNLVGTYLEECMEREKGLSFKISLCEVSCQTEEEIVLHKEEISSSINDVDIRNLHLEEAWDVHNIVEDVTKLAHSNISNFGIAYDHKTNTYYDSKNNCHYIPELQLYYYHDLKSYYYFDPDSQSLRFHSHNNSDQTIKLPILLSTSEDYKEQLQEEVINEIDKDKNSSSTEECSSKSPNDSQEFHLSSINTIIEAGPKPFEPDPEKHIAPCIRLIVLETELEDLEIGSLFIVTCQGGTLGREGNHDVVIPDRNVSKHHANLTYEFLKNGTDLYKIVDVGSMNGTFLDGVRLSKSLQKSDSFVVSHGSIIKVGSTSLECHIHIGIETCSNCEPGCIKRTLKTDIDEDVISKRKTIGEQHKIEVQRLKTKFSLGYQCDKVTLPPGYLDRSQKRREEVGSSHSSEKTDSASYDRPIKKQNKGYELLSKMGWKEGQSLGKNEDRLSEPVFPVIRQKNLGLGNSVLSTSLPSKSDEKKNLIWQKTRLRFSKLNVLQKKEKLDLERENIKMECQESVAFIDKI